MRQIELSDSEISMFQSLHESRLGDIMVEYVDRLAASLCDSRSLDNDISSPEGQIEFKGRLLAARILTEHIKLLIVQRDDVVEKNVDGKSYR